VRYIRSPYCERSSVLLLIFLLFFFNRLDFEEVQAHVTRNLIDDIAHQHKVFTNCLDEEEDVHHLCSFSINDQVCIEEDHADKDYWLNENPVKFCIGRAT